MRRKSRRLSEQDRALWSTVTRDISPLPSRPAKPEGAIPVTPPLPTFQPPPTLRPPVERAVPPEPKTSVTRAPDPMHMAGPPAMDAKAFGKLKRGKLVPEARIDLHGMTAERAYGVLRGFMLDAHARGLRLVLVITGKGRTVDDNPDPSRRGILRNAVPQWLAQAPLKPLILQIAPAHQRHGGGGAYYVYLRRRR